MKIVRENDFRWLLERATRQPLSRHSKQPSPTLSKYRATPAQSTLPTPILWPSPPSERFTAQRPLLLALAEIQRSVSTMTDHVGEAAQASTGAFSPCVAAVASSDFVDRLAIYLSGRGCILMYTRYIHLQNAPDYPA